MMEVHKIVPFIYNTTYDVSTGEQSIIPTANTVAEVMWQNSPVVNNGLLLMSNLHSLVDADATAVNPYQAIRKTKGTYIQTRRCLTDVHCLRVILTSG